MDLVNKQDIALVEICQHGNQISGLFNCRAGGYAHVYAHLVCYNGRKCCFAKSRRAMQQNMIEWFIAKARGVNENAQIVLCFFLADIFGYCSRPEAPLAHILRQMRRCSHYRSFLQAFRKIYAHLLFPHIRFFSAAFTICSVSIVPMSKPLSAAFISAVP